MKDENLFPVIPSTFNRSSTCKTTNTWSQHKKMKRWGQNNKMRYCRQVGYGIETRSEPFPYWPLRSDHGSPSSPGWALPFCRLSAADPSALWGNLYWERSGFSAWSTPTQMCRAGTPSRSPLCFLYHLEAEREKINAVWSHWKEQTRLHL